MSTTHAEGKLSERSPVHWINRAAFQLVVILLGLTQAGIFAAVYYQYYWLAALLVLPASHFMHGALIGFHEASHGLLRKSRLLNEIDGVLIGVLSLVSFSLYRVLHQAHHVHLATAKDEEFWPHTEPTVRRGLRMFVAIGELTAGLIVGPFIFFRAFVRKGSPIRNRRVRRRIWAEYALTVVFWATVLTIVALMEAWPYFLWAYLAPAWIAANLQSWRKYIEHIGLTGDTVNGVTRSIVARGPMGRLVALTLLHEPFHGVHHSHAGLPHAELPQRASELEPKAPGERPPFRSYTHAFMDLLSSLRNPRMGAHWNDAPQTADQTVSSS